MPTKRTNMADKPAGSGYAIGGKSLGRKKLMGTSPGPTQDKMVLEKVLVSTTTITTNER